jgi:hypothetical protein
MASAGPYRADRLAFVERAGEEPASDFGEDCRMNHPLETNRTCGGCVNLSECAYEFGAHRDDPVCTGYRWPLAVEVNGEPA